MVFTGTGNRYAVQKQAYSQSLLRCLTCLREVHYFSMHAHLRVDYPAYTTATYESINI